MVGKGCRSASSNRVRTYQRNTGWEHRCCTLLGQEKDEPALGLWAVAEMEGAVNVPRQSSAAAPPPGASGGTETRGTRAHCEWPGAGDGCHCPAQTVPSTNAGSLALDSSAQQAIAASQAYPMHNRSQPDGRDQGCGLNGTLQKHLDHRHCALRSRCRDVLLKYLPTFLICITLVL
jgi:hypothetical protein